MQKSSGFRAAGTAYSSGGTERGQEEHQQHVREELVHALPPQSLAHGNAAGGDRGLRQEAAGERAPRGPPSPGTCVQFSHILRFHVILNLKLAVTAASDRYLSGSRGSCIRLQGGALRSRSRRCSPGCAVLLPRHSGVPWSLGNDAAVTRGRRPVRQHGAAGAGDVVRRIERQGAGDEC